MINIESNTGVIQIQLLDNPFVNEWKEHFIMMLDTPDTVLQHQLINYPYIDYQESFTEDHIEIRKRTTELYAIIEELNELGTDFPITIQEIDNELEKLENSWDWFKSGTIELDALLDDEGSFISYQFEEVPAAGGNFMQLLNKIHRCCTVATRDLHAAPSHTQPNTWFGEIFLYWSDDINSKFTLKTTDIDRFYTLVELGNNSVHNIDCIVPTELHDSL